MNVESKYHREKWENSCGYLFPENISSSRNLSSFDIIQARIRYGFEIDTDLERYIESSFRNLSEEEFWATVVASKWDLYGPEWKEYEDRGKDHKHIQLMEVMNSNHPPQLRQDCLQKLRDEKSKYLPPKKVERIPAPRLEKEYKVKTPEKQDIADGDFLSWIDEEEVTAKADYMDAKDQNTYTENTESSSAEERWVQLYPGVREVTNTKGEELREVEDFIERNLQTFILVGEAIKKIRDERLYLERYPNFEEYCRKYWGWGRSYVNKQIDSFETALLLPPNNKPLLESQARALTPLAKENPDAAIEAWHTITEKAKEEGRRVTAKDVEEEVEKYSSKAKPTVASIDGFSPQYNVTMSNGKKQKKSHQYLLDIGYTEEQLAEYRRNND